MCLMDDARRSNIGAKSQVSITHPSREARLLDCSTLQGMP